MSGFLVQIEPELDQVEPQADKPGFTQISDERLQEIGSEIQRIAKLLVSSIKLDKLAPKELEIEFGIGIKGEGGIPFLAKGSIETNFAVKAKWVV